MPAPPRTASGRRDYGPEHIMRLRMIRGCRDLGFSLAKTRELLDMAETPAAACGEIKTVVNERLANIRVRDAVEMGAEVIAVSCPFCLLTLEDAVKAEDLEDKIRVMDIMEIINTTI